MVVALTITAPANSPKRHAKMTSINALKYAAVRSKKFWKDFKLLIESDACEAQ
jgi:hypothetical protein